MKRFFYGGAAFLATALYIGIAALPAHTQEATTAGDLPTAPAGTADPLTPVTLALRENRTADAAKLLRAMDVKTMEATVLRRYLRIAALVAVRTGDGVWHRQITQNPAYPDASAELITATASRLLQDGYPDKAQVLLAQISDPETVNEIPRRRYYELHTRIAQMKNDAPAERKTVARLVGIISEWSSDKCQACHANPRKFGTQVTTFDAYNWWVGQRFATLVKGKDAERIVTEETARLAKDPNNTQARLRLAYALRSQGKDVDAEKALREIPWTEFADKEKRAPLRLATFP